MPPVILSTGQSVAVLHAVAIHNEDENEHYKGK